MIARLLIHKGLQIRFEKIGKILAQNDLSANHPDLLYFPYDSKLGIGEARKIKEHFSMKPYSATGRAVVLEDASVLTLDAQNALLKLLEEPPENSLLILGAPSEDKLLPTVLSRCQIVILEGAKRPIESSGQDSIDPSGLQNDIDNLLKSSIEERFEYIEKLKDREEFLHALVLYFRHELHAPGSLLARLEVVNFLKELLQAEEWAAANVNIRAILEYLMLVCPVGK